MQFNGTTAIYSNLHSFLFFLDACLASPSTSSILFSLVVDTMHADTMRRRRHNALFWPRKAVAGRRRQGNSPNCHG